MANKPIIPFSKQKKIFLENMIRTERKGGTMLILVIVANILDPHIGKGCKRDIHSIRNMFREMSDHMGFHMVELIIKGTAYSIKNVNESIEALEPGDDDIVVFYYTGHGFRFEKGDTEVYPHVYLQPFLPKATTEIINENSINLKDIFEKVKARGARLNIVIGDCCNNPINFERKFSGGGKKKVPRKEEPMKIDTDMCKALFCDPTASILVASADKGEFSISDDKLGSIFTFNFTKNLKILLSTPPGSMRGLPWEKFLEKSKEKTFSLSKTYNIGDEVEKAGHQKPIFKIK